MADVADQLATAVAQRMSEKQLQDMIVATAKLLGWRVMHVYDSRRSEPGWPDLFMVRNGRVVIAEVKSYRGRLSPAQREWINDLQATTWAVYVWRPLDWLNGHIEEVLR